LMRRWDMLLYTCVAPRTWLAWDAKAAAKGSLRVAEAPRFYRPPLRQTLFLGTRELQVTVAALPKFLADRHTTLPRFVLAFSLLIVIFIALLIGGCCTLRAFVFERCAVAQRLGTVRLHAVERRALCAGPSSVRCRRLGGLWGHVPPEQHPQEGQGSPGAPGTGPYLYLSLCPPRTRAGPSHARTHTRTHTHVRPFLCERTPLPPHRQTAHPKSPPSPTVTPFSHCADVGRGQASP
jgi:hypothetical protein